jgi:ElaB/YqjD/DUF883 family membrane-anchored ribosome-binding protein
MMKKDEMNDQDRAAASATEQLRAQAGTVREDLGQLGRLAKDATREKVGDARAFASDYYDKGRAKAEQLEAQLVDQIRAKPLKSILIAAGIGALFGFLVTRR